jgi:transposase
MQAVLRVRRGESIRAVARNLGYSHSTVVRWVARAPEDGRETIPTLRSKPKTHPKALSPEIVAAIVAERLAHGRCAEVVHATLAKRGVAVSLSSVKRTLKRQELIAPKSKWKRYRPPVPRPAADAPGSLVQNRYHSFRGLVYQRKVLPLHRH